MKIYQKIKRLFDFYVSLILLVLSLPIFLLVSIIIRHKLGTPVIFRQVRPGLYGKPFVMYKFRSMTNEKDQYGRLLPDSKRLNRFGHLLRKYSLDELPELINVLKGDMSLVGPRPLLMQYLERYNDEQARRHDVKPGVTGWAQINGRNSLSWNEKFQMDLWYIENKNFCVDLKIIFLTLIQLYKHEGIHQKGHVTVEEFRGDCE